MVSLKEKPKILQQPLLAGFDKRQLRSRGFSLNKIPIKVIMPDFAIFEFSPQNLKTIAAQSEVA